MIERIPYRARPGAGFVVLVSSVALATAFFGAGLITPRLDRVWGLQIDLRLGQREPLERHELELLQSALCDHPGLAEGFIDERAAGLISANRDGFIENGYAYVIRRKAKPKIGVVVALPGTEKREQIAVHARTTRDEVEGVASRERPFTWVPEDKGGCPTLIEVRTSHSEKGSKKKRNTALVSAKEIP